jgi:predicted nucleic acid-binding protein
LHLLDIEKRAMLEIQNEDSGYTNEQRRIINDFLDWDDKEKNEILFRLIAFSVDYCRLTTKKNINSFTALLKGKKFYIDANVIYRLMGINNESRRKAMKEFVEKCRETGIELLYTNVTYKELTETFVYYVDKIKQVLQVTNASPTKIKKLYDVKDDNGFYDIYYKWAGENKSYGKWNDFLYYLKGQLRDTIASFRKVTIQNSQVFDKEKFEILVDDLECFKRNSSNSNRRSINRVNVEYDINNILHLLDERKKNGKNAWEINEYMISADHGLVEWADRMFLGEVPYVVLPSIWYSLLLKLTGRTEDDYKAYVEFMKLRYTQTINYTPEEIIYDITQLTEKGEIQDRVIDILTDENLLITKDNEQLEIQEKVRIAYDKAVDEIRKNEYNDGYSLGNVEGYRSGKEDAEKFSYEKGKRVATLEIKKDALLRQIADKAKKKKRINYIIIGIGTIFILAVVFLVCKWVWHDLSPDKVDQFDLIITILSCALGGTVWMMIKYFLCVDLKVLEDRERNKVIDELDDIERNLKELK